MKAYMLLLLLATRSLAQVYNFNSNTYAVDEGGQVEIVVIRTSTDTTERSVIVIIQNGTTADVIGTSLIASFQPSDLSSTVVFSTVDDGIPEPDEVFVLQLKSSPDSPIIIGETNTANIIIRANDNAAGIFSLQSTERQTISEGETTTVTIKRSAGAFGSVVIYYGITNGQADFQVPAGSVTFTDGERIKSIDLMTLDDYLAEEEEVFTLVLSTNQSEASIVDAVRQIVVIDNDILVSFAQEARYLDEKSNSYSATIALTVERGQATPVEDITVSYRVSGKSADPNVDFILNDNSITFLNGELRKNITIMILPDEIPELTEELQISLVGVDGGAIISTPNTTTVKILGNDDENGVVLFDPSQQSPMFINEDQTVTSVTLTLIRNAGTFGKISVFYNITGSSSVADSISPPSGEVMIGDGETSASFTLQAIADSTPEVSQSFTVRLVSVAGGARIAGVQEKIVIIQDSDIAHGVVQWTSGAHSITTVTSPRYLTWTLERNGGVIGDIVITFTCSYSVNGVAVPGALVSNRPYQVILRDSQSAATVTVDIAPTTFLSVGGQFQAIIDEVKLLTEYAVQSFNSPYKGKLQSDSVIVEPSDANGEIGFTNPAIHYITEPETGVNKVSIPISREGTSGTATVSWTLEGHQPSAINSEDVSSMEGTAILPSGSSVVNIEIDVVADNVSETREYMVLKLVSVQPSDTQRLRDNFTQITLVIEENDNPGGVFQLTRESAVPIVKAEGDKFTLSVERVGGDLVSRTILFSISGDGESEFYGATSTLVFEAGQNLKTIHIYAANDDIPELSETYMFSIRSHGEPAAVIGSPMSTNITIMENDFPYGLIHFLVDAKYTLFESKGSNISSAQMVLVRDAGTFGRVSVTWRLRGNDTSDLTPTSGVVVFLAGEDTAILEISSKADKLPEGMESFEIELISASSGAVITSPNSTMVYVSSNDAAIYFQGPPTISAVEGETITLTVQRADSSTSASVKFRTANHTADPADYGQVDGEIVFDKGQSEATFQVEITDDTSPEPLELFYIQLFEPVGDVVVHNLTEVIVLIKANDNSNGVFKFGGPYSLTVSEGDNFILGIIRDKGAFRSVTLKWWILSNGTMLSAGEEFVQHQGFITFDEGQTEQNLELSTLIDGIPEYEEEFTVQLVNVSGGGPGREQGVISPTHSSVVITIPTNDNPNGVLVFKPTSRELTVAEDFIEPAINSTMTTFDLIREQGLFGDIKVLWEVYTSQLAGILPDIRDLLFLSELGGDLDMVMTGSREGIQSGVYNFTGAPGSYASLASEYQVNWVEEDFALSIWVKPDPGCNGYILTKASESQSEVYYAVRMTADSVGVPVAVVLSLLDHQTKTLGTTQTLWTTEAVNDEKSENQWHHILVNVGGDVADFIFNGILAAQKSVPGARIDSSGRVYIGATLSAKEKYTGLMQDLRLFNRKLTPVEISEIVNYPSHLDVDPISGFLYMADGESRASISLRAVQDVEAESNEVFSVKLISIKGGAIISPIDSLAKLTVLKSDYANGLFGFDGPCQPFQASSEGMPYSCLVKRDRGDAGTVTLFWRIDQLGTNGTITQGHDDFNSSSGRLTFSPGQLHKEIVFEAVDDNMPELMEHFRVVLVSVESTGGEQTTPLSGASIDMHLSTTNISLLENDLPYGLLQFSNDTAEIMGDDIIPVSNYRPMRKVEEDVGVVQLQVERAHGIIGEVSVEFRTKDGTAKSTGVPSPDFVSRVGRVNFAEGQRYAYINITVIDDVIAEDDKYFTMQLVNPTGGASLGLASTLTVIILHSDDAYGIIQFDSVSLTQFASEAVDGATDVDLKIKRTGGLIGSTIVSWRILGDFGSDFLTQSGVIELIDGESQAFITVSIRPDSMPELDEAFTVELANVSQGRLGDSVQSVVTVLANDDPYGVFKISANSKIIRVSESNTEVTVAITRTRGYVGVVSLGFQTVPAGRQSQFFPVGISRANDEDFVPINGSITFKTNVTTHNITIQLREDDIPEADEYFIVELTSASLLSGGQERPLANSPRIGSDPENFAQIIIDNNDGANGILELSTSLVTISESTQTPFLSVNRKAGLFGEVIVRFEVLPNNATANVDYFFTSNNVILFEGESSKQMPIYISDDGFPELGETFTVRLMPFVTGGATLGELTECLVVIQPSDDPYGVFEFSSPLLAVDEPSDDLHQVDIRVNRLGGTMNIVALQWTATLDHQELLADEDIEPSFGTIYFNSNQPSQVIRIHVKADSTPEPTELIIFNLTHATNGGRVGLNRLFTLRIRANDNPHGTVEFAAEKFELTERETTSSQNVTVVRSGGTFGDVRVYYSTAMIDISVLAQGIIPTDTEYLWFYTDPLLGYSNTSGSILDKSNQANPLQACAEFCLLETNCVSFQMNQTSLVCSWFEEVPIVHESDSSGLLTFYNKVDGRVSSVYNSQAQSETDYRSMTTGSTVIPDGQSSAQLQISVLADFLPELDEQFHIILNGVELLSGSVDRQVNEPTLGKRTTATAIIRYNDNANGMVRIYSRDPRALDGGQTVYVEEREHFSVELIVERTGGTIGDIAVSWFIDIASSNASRDTDYIADGATLTFAAGEDVRVITIGIQDDDVPEYDELLVVQLTDPEGGALLDTRSKVNVVIQANDNVAGIIGFTSSSYIAKEGDTIDIGISRSLPAAGIVSLMWSIVGVNGHVVADAFTQTSGMLIFQEVQQLQTISVHVMDDDLPEVNEEYRIIISNVSTAGISRSGGAATDLHRSTASITVEASNNPHGVFSLASSSLDIELTEEHGDSAYLVVDRKFGSIGLVRIYYTVRSGHLKEITGELEEATAGTDFIPTEGYLDIADGQNSGHLSVNITDDSIPEIQEVFVVELTGVKLLEAAGGTKTPPLLGSTDIVTEVFISANDGTRGELEFPEEFHILKVNESARQVEVQVQRAYGTYGDVSVFIYSQTNQNALLGQDYNFKALELAFGPGEKSKAVIVHILDDDIPEADEIFELVLASPKGGATLGQHHTAQIYINENDGAGGTVQFSSNDTLFLQETFTSNGFPTFSDIKLIRGPGIFGQIELTYTIVNSEGIQTSDVEPSNGTIKFLNLQQSALITLSALDDSIPEFAEQLTIRLQSQYAFFLGDIIEKEIVISASDYPNGLLSIGLSNGTSELEVEESGNSTVICEVTRSGGLFGKVSATIHTVSQTASADFGENIFVSPLQFFDEEAIGYCSSGDYLLVLNSGSSKLLKFGGMYQLLSNLQHANEVIKCVAYQYSRRDYFIVISRDEVIMYAVSEDGTLTSSDRLSQVNAVDGIYFQSNDKIFVSMLTASIDNSEYTLQTYSVDGDQLLMTDHRLGFSSFTAIETIANFVCVAQAQNIKVYRVTGGSWTLQQTLQTGMVKDIAVGQEANQVILVVAVEDAVRLYRKDGTSFVLVKEATFVGVETVSGFSLRNSLLILVLATSESYILRTDLTIAWKGNVSENMIPVKSSPHTDDSTLIGVFGERSSINVVASLDQPDYIPRMVQVNFLEGENKKYVSIPLLDDDIPEDTESFHIRLDKPTGGATIGEDNSVTVSILSNDNAHGAIQFSQDSMQLVAEEESFDSLVQFTLRRLGGTHGIVSVQWIASANHNFSSDISPTRGIVQFSPGQDIAQLGITVRADDTAENSELINITLIEIVDAGTPLPDRGATLGVIRSATLLILANELPYGVVRWERQSLVVAEPEQSAETVVPLVIVREQGTAGDLQVTYITSRDILSDSDRQAISGQDYVSKQQTVNIRENQTRAVLDVTIKADDLPETEEQFLVNITSVRLLGVENSGIGPDIRRGGDVVTVVIAENDNARGVVQLDVQLNNEGRIDVYEAAGEDMLLQIKLVRDVGQFGEISVVWQILPREVTAEDISAFSGSVAFMQSQKEAFIELYIIDDDLPEPMEMFDVRLISVSGGATLGTLRSVRVAILKNDSPNGMFAFIQTLFTVEESLEPARRTADIQVERSQGAQGVVNVNWQLEANAAADFEQPHSGVLRFEVGQTKHSFFLTVKLDSVLEGQESFKVALSSADNNADLSVTHSTADIIIQANLGSSGHIEVVDNYKTVVVAEPTASYDGSQNIILTRGIGTFGEVTFTWSITPAKLLSFVQTEGQATFLDGQQTAEVIIQTVDNTEPEQRQLFIFQVTSASAGATVSVDSAKVEVMLAASDHPIGLFEFSTADSIHVSEDSSQVSIAVVRNFGVEGQVQVAYTTVPGTAHQNSDYLQKTGSIVFTSGQQSQSIVIELLQDDIAEGPEVFYIKLISATLQSPAQMYNFTEVNGIQLDQPPMVGVISERSIIIDKNDNAEGVIQFEKSSTSVVFEETVGLASLIVTRGPGTYGSVAVLFNVTAETALANEDFFLEGGELYLADGISRSSINVTIVDDTKREMPEFFQVALTSVRGGAVLGPNINSYVTISKSDYPNGKFSFAGPLDRTVANPETKFTISLTVSRTEGLQGKQSLKWKIFGPNSLQPLNTVSDISYRTSNGAETTEGQLLWEDGDGSSKSIVLEIKGFTGWEIQKTFVIRITDIQHDTNPVKNGEVDSSASQVKVTVLKNGDPNGILQLSEASREEKEFDEPQGVKQEVTFFVERLDGNLGDQNILWEVVGGDGDIEPASGSVLMTEGVSTAPIRLNIIDDDIPELTENFQLRLLNVIGGATIKPDANTVNFQIKYNDDPHGFFELPNGNQELQVHPLTLQRYLNTTVYRRFGLFGSVEASLRISFSQQSLQFPLTETVVFDDRQAEAILIIDVIDDIFIELESYFTIDLVNLVYVRGPSLTAPPRFKPNSAVTINVPETAANSYVSFESPIFTVNEATQSFVVTVKRIGLYGEVLVKWSEGYLATPPAGFQVGATNPSNGILTIAHGERYGNSTIYVLLPSFSDNTHHLFAIYLENNPTTTSPGGAKLSSTNTLAEIDPSGVIRFAASQVSVHENQGSLTLTIQRLYGSRNSIRVKYSTQSETALAEKDFVSIQSQSIVLTERQLTAEITLSIQLDSAAEQDEKFAVLLESVEVLPTTDQAPVSPRISDIVPSCSVTIKANGDPHGLLDVVLSAPRVVERNLNTVTVTIRRNGGAFGHVTTRVRTVAGGESWDQQIVMLAKSSFNNTISEALSNRDTRQSATAASDYQILNTEIAFEQGEIEKELVVNVLDDNEAESDESVYIYLTEPTGGARIAEGAPDGMKYGYAVFEIIRNDNWNGVIGYSTNSRNVTVSEDDGGRVTLSLIRTSHALFTYDTTVQWEALFPSNPILANELVRATGVVICKSLQSTCEFHIELVEDQTPEFSYSFPVRLFNPSAGSTIDERNALATVTVFPSDDPYGKVQFRDSYIVVNRFAEEVVIGVDRMQGSSFEIAVSYKAHDLDVEDLYRAGLKVYSANENDDYSPSQGQIVFQDGVTFQNFKIQLTPQNSVSNKYPKVFQVVIYEPLAGAVLGTPIECTVMIVEAPQVDIWTTHVSASVQEMDDNAIEYLISTIVDKDFTEMSKDALTILEDVLKRIIQEGELRPLLTSSRQGLISIFCSLMSSKVKSTSGRLSIMKLFERFIFTLAMGETCETERHPYPDISCSNFRFSLIKVLPHRVNGYTYSSSSRNSLKLGEDIVNPSVNNGTCLALQFIEYDTPHWFIKRDQDTLLDDKVLSVNIKGFATISKPSVTYKIYTANGRRTYKRAECVYYNELSLLWSSNVCEVSNELQLGTNDFVECQCDHLSSYAVNSLTREKAFIGYPNYLFIVTGCCMFCILTAILVHLIFPCGGLFTVKVVIHELACSFCLLGVYLLTAYLSPDSSPDQILVTPDESNYKCTILGFVLHYFLLAQFVWMLLQSVNLWLICTKNDENTKRFHCKFVTLGYGLTALFVGSFYGFTYYTYQEYDLDPQFIYTDVNNEREMCFLNNQYAALAGIVAPVLVCAIGIFVFVGDLSGKAKQWKSYDDIFAGRANRGEIWPVIFLWFIIIMVNLTGGLHMAYNYNWMMIAFCVCLSILAVFTIGYFAMLRGPCNRAKNGNNTSSDKYQSTLIMNTTGGESMVQHHQIDYPSPIPHVPESTGGNLLITAPPNHNHKWGHDSEDGLPNQSMVQRSPSTGFDLSSLSRRSELSPDDDTRDLGELIMALKENRPRVTVVEPNHLSLLTSTEDESDETDSHHGAYNVSGQISIADTHL